MVDAHNNLHNQRLKTWASTAAVSMASLLIALKLTAWFMTDSVAVLSSFLDSVLDLGTSAMIFFAVRTAQQPPDAKHRFGHSKAESSAALVEGSLIIGSAVFLIIEAVRDFFYPSPMPAPDLAIMIMGVAVALTSALVLFQMYVVRRTHSLAIRADLAHYRTDIVTQLAVIGALALTARTGIAWIDPLVGMLVAVYLVRVSRKIIISALEELMDAELPRKQREMIASIVRQHPEVIDFHDLRTRRAGGDFFIEMHLELKGTLSLRDAHMITDDVEQEIRRHFRSAFVTIHQEPAGINDARDSF